MKTIKNITIGIILGSLIFFANHILSNTYASELFKDRINLRDIDFEQVFAPNSQGQDLYMLIYKKYVVEPEDQAVKQIAYKNGLTVNEADMIVNGSISALYTNENSQFSDQNFSDLNRRYVFMQTEFQELKDYYQLTGLLDIHSKSSEIFANGDLSDSGFDLIYDLNIIEEILFAEESDSSISTFNFAEDLDDLENAFLNALNDTEYIEKIESESENESNNNDNTEYLENSAEDKSILEDDLCVDGSTQAGSDLGDALRDYEVNTQNPNQNSSESSPISEIIGANNEIAPLKSDSWVSSFCPDQLSASGRANQGISSLSSLSDKISMGYSSSTESSNNALALAICLNTEYISESYSTVTVAKSSVKSELDLITAYLDEVLSHNLVPNKVTGSYLESSKCKSALTLTPSLNIISMSAPVATPSNHDMIADSNIFEEWNTFIEDYRPFLSDAGKTTIDYESEFIVKGIPEDYSLAATIQDIQDYKNYQVSIATQEIENSEIAKNASNLSSSMESLSLEVIQMKKFFETINSILNDINKNACSEILNKDNIQ